ncbi:hypothetical protein AUC31_06855 [Planococcus rifietoensis]|uniref:Uncharacterized protein n=1 Tax=Planococcus rifietoensis TaxID=200991 RepID=A0A0U2J700_9BACL|nr:hypothetical protein AUC31_06855 [Planococcus rifietoensis]
MNSSYLKIQKPYPTSLKLVGYGFFITKLSRGDSPSFMNCFDLFHQSNPFFPVEIIQLQLCFSQNHMDTVKFLVRPEPPPAFRGRGFCAWLKVSQGDFGIDDVFYSVDIQQIMREIDIKTERRFMRRKAKIDY